MWDELPMANVAIFEALDILLRRITGNQAPFGGKIIIGIGDFRQVAPVVKGGGPSAAYLASILSSPLWHLFSITQLNQPIRNATDPDFADFIDTVGESPNLQRIQLHTYLAQIHNIHTLSDLLFPNHILSDPLQSMRRAFLSPLNIDVDKFNADILDRLPGPLCMHISPITFMPSSCVL
jgi:ATP-dependent DNA helicase PIF1